MVEKNLHEDQLVPIEIDLGLKRKGTLDESFLAYFGDGIKMILRRMFGFDLFPVNVKGTPSEIKSFANALAKEKRYMKSYSKFGLNDPRTYRNKYKLDIAVKDFEKETGLKWPLK